jgi:PAS domain S-box-containing protein
MDLIALLPVALALWIAVIIILGYAAVRREADRNEAARYIVQGVFDLNILTHEYVGHRAARVRGQWLNRHGGIAGRLARLQPADAQEQALHERLITECEHVGKLFARLVENYDALEKQPADAALLAQHNERIVGQLLTASQAMVSDASRLAETSRARFLRDQRRSYALILLSALLTAVLLAAASLAVSRSVTRRLTRLHEGTETLVLGNLERRIDVRGADEIGQLARAFNEMTARLRESLAELETEIASRKAAQTELAAEKEQLRVTLHSIGDAVIATDPEARVVLMNEVAEQLTGYTEDAARSRPLTDVFHIIDEQTRRACEDPVARVLREGQIVGLANHTALIARDGTERSIADAGAPIRDRDGRILGVVLVFRDVTEFRRAQEELQRERNFNSAVLDTAGALIVVLDRQGVISRFNCTCEEVTGYKAPEVLGRPFWDIFLLPEEVDGVRKVFQNLRAGQFPMRHENYWRTRDGEPRLISWSNTCLTDAAGQVEHIVATGIDVTEERRIQEQRQLDEARLEALLKLSQMTESPVETLVQFAIAQAVNLSASKIGCLAFLEETGAVQTMHVWPPADDEAGEGCPLPPFAPDLWQQALQRRSSLIENEPDPAAPRRRYMIVPFVDENRTVALAAVGDKDKPYDEADLRELTLLLQGTWQIVRRQRTRRELERYQRQLERLVDERTEELRATNESLKVEVAERVEAQRRLGELVAELERSNRELEQFAYVASHDLQEPLRMIASYVQLLQRRYAGKLDEDATEFIGYAVDGASRMKQLINDMLAFSRVGSRAKPFRLTDLNRVLELVLANLQAAIKDTGASVVVEPLPELKVDELQIAQLFQNLISNALKFRKPGTPPEVRVSAEKQGEYWQFNVRDNGIGIDPKYCNKIFVIFQRLHAKTEYEGTGIGLAVCKKIVDRHGGRIWVESEPGNGSAFKFTLPVERST